MIAELVADRYSQALLEIAKEQEKTSEFLSELQYISDQVERFKRLRQALLAPDIPPAVKLKIVKRIFSSQVSEVIMNFLCLLIEKEREMYLSQIIKKFRKKVNNEKNILDVEIVLATFPSMELVEEIKKSLSQATGKEVEVTIHRDPRIIGGIKIIIEDKIIDLSIEGQVERLGRKLLEIYSFEGGTDGIRS